MAQVFWKALAPALQSFSTNFPTAENPISEGGQWTSLATTFSRIRTTGGHAVGTQTGADGDNDSYAHLSGFGPNQSAQGTIWIDSSVNVHDGGVREVEIHMRCSDNASNVFTYECNYALDGTYCQIVRWNGPFNNFTFLSTMTPPRSLVSGDVLSATIVGSTITQYLNGVQINTATDSTYSTGNPGLGHFIQGSVDPTLFGFSRYVATSP